MLHLILIDIFVKNKKKKDFLSLHRIKIVLRLNDIQAHTKGEVTLLRKVIIKKGGLYYNTIKLF